MSVKQFITWMIQEYARELIYALVMLTWAVVRATGVLVDSGQAALKFSFGRARGVLEEGFHLLIPFLQVVRIVPIRSRTLDLAAQRVTTLDGLVYRVDSSLVYRITDVERALIEIDHLERGMLQTLGLAVQEVLCGLEREQLKVSDSLNARLEGLMARQLSPWGVALERVGFNTITPSPETLRLTQLAHRVEQKGRALALLERGGVPRRLALPLLGGVSLPVRRVVPAIRREARHRRRHRMVRLGRWLARYHGLTDKKKIRQTIDRVAPQIRNRPVLRPSRQRPKQERPEQSIEIELG